MILFGRSIHQAVEPVRDLLRRDVGELGFAEGKMLLQETGVVIERPALVLLDTRRQKKRLRLVPRDALGTRPAERSFGQDMFCLGSGLGEGMTGYRPIVTRSLVLPWTSTNDFVPPCETRRPNPGRLSSVNVTWPRSGAFTLRTAISVRLPILGSP